MSLKVWLPAGLIVPGRVIGDIEDGVSLGLLEFSAGGIRYRVLYSVPGDVLFVECAGAVKKVIAFLVF